MTHDLASTSPNVTPTTFVVGPDDLPPQHVEAVLQGALAARAEVAVIEVEGPSAVQCMQGLLTNDLELPGDRAFVYGAVLTPKGMIICDMWVARDGGLLTLFAPAHGKEALLNTLKRYVPPRLARYTDRSADWAVLRLVGPQAANRADRARMPLPKLGFIERGENCVLARPAEGGPFALQIECRAEKVDQFNSELADIDVEIVDSPVLELARIIAGWPRLGAEIDAKTLPQEARYDELGGVSYAKGCYTGQETVARLHSRGHTNKRLLGLRWETVPDPDIQEIIRDERQVGRLTSIAWLGTTEGYVGLGMIRREVDIGATVTAAGHPAQCVRIPFEIGGSAGRRVGGRAVGR